MPHPAWALQCIRQGLRAALSADDILTLQRAAGNQAVRRLLEGDGDVRAAAAHAFAGPAGPLPFHDRIQKAFGHHDLSQTQTHTGARAAEGAAAIGAAAFTSGDHIALPGTPSLHTVAHEAAHVIQQRAGVHLPGGIGTAGDRYERHADAVANLVVQGGNAQALLDAHPGGTAQTGFAVQRVAESDKAAIGMAYKPDEYGGATAARKLNVLWARIKTLVQKTVTEKVRAKIPAAVKAKLADMTVEQVVELLELDDKSKAEDAQEQRQVPLQDPELSGTERTVIRFDIDGLGSGRILLFQDPNKPAYDKLLAWVSHGYTITNGLTPAKKERSFGFLVPQFTTLERPQYTKDFYKKHIDKLAQEKDKEPLFLGAKAPDMAVSPHMGDLRTADLETLKDVTPSCDVAVLVEFTWAKDCKEEYKERMLYPGTPPLPELLDGIEPLASYDTMLMLTCRTPWTKDAGLYTGKAKQQADDIYPAFDPTSPEVHPDSPPKFSSKPKSSLEPQEQQQPEPPAPAPHAAPAPVRVQRPPEQSEACTLAFEGDLTTVTLKGKVDQQDVQQLMHAYRPQARAMEGQRAPGGPGGFLVFGAGPKGLHITKLTFANEAVARRLVQALNALK